MTTTRKRAQAQVVVDHDGDPFAVTVTHELVDHGYTRTPQRNVWHWEIRSTTDAADWQPVRYWSGCDLSSALDVADPDPIAALCSLGSFLAAYAEACTYADTRRVPREEIENTGLFPATLPVDLAQDIADAIMAEFGEDDAR